MKVLKEKLMSKQLFDNKELFLSKKSLSERGAVHPNAQGGGELISLSFGYMDFKEFHETNSNVI